MFFNTAIVMSPGCCWIDEPPANLPHMSEPLRDALAERIVAAARSEPERVWRRSDVGRVLVDVLVEQRFDFNHRAHLEQLKQLMIEAYTMAQQIVPADRQRF